MSATTQANDLPIIGKNEKIRYGFSQWNHFGSGGVDEEEFIESMRNVGLTVLSGNGGDEGRRWSAIAHKHGIRYFAGLFISTLYDNRIDEWRLAVDREGLTCPDRGGRRFRVPCPLDRRAWDVLFRPAVEGAKEGWLDGAQLDMEPYGAYTFDVPGEHLCYCDDCFAQYLAHADLEEDRPRAERYTWLKDNGHLLPYLQRLHDRLTELLQDLAADIRKDHPTFGFSAYPDWIPDHLTGHWRMQALALGLHHPDAPFIVINSTPYWEDHTRPWWEAPIFAYRSMGLKHVMGSWDGGLSGHHPQVHVGAAEAMVEMAMASDGFWRWGERQYSTEEWQTLAQANRRIRDIETRLGEFLFQGEPLRNFVTLVEHSGNPLLDRALVTQTYRLGNRHLVRVVNANTERPATLTVRFPQAGEGDWQVRDGMTGVRLVQSDGTDRWTRARLFEGLVLTLDGREDIYLVLEPWSEPADSFRAVRSLGVKPHRPRPTAGPPIPARLQLALSDDFSGALSQWETRFANPGKDEHAVRIQDGELIIDAGTERGSGRGFLITKQTFPASAELSSVADPGQVFFRIEFTAVRSSSPHSGGLLVGATVENNEAGGTRILDALVATGDVGTVVPWATFKEGRPYHDSKSPQTSGFQFKTTRPRTERAPIRVDWIAGVGGGCERIEVFVNGEPDGTMTDTTNGESLGFPAGALGFWLLLDRDLVIDDFRVWQIALDNDAAARDAIAADETATDGHAAPSEVLFTTTVYGDEMGYRGQNLYQQATTALALSDAATGTTRPLFKMQGYCREPVFSPDRKLAAAAVWVNGKGQIYLINTRTGRGWNISTNDFSDRSPAFSPDGEQVVFVSDRDGYHQVYIMNRDGSDARCLSASSSRHRSPSFSPNGDRVAFVSDRDGDFNVYTVKTDGSDLRVIAPQRGSNTYDPAWSPDGTRLCWSVQSRQLRRLVLANADGSGHQEMPLTQAGERRFGHGAATDMTSLRFSPDGTKVAGAYTDYRTSGIFLLDLANASIRKLEEAMPVMIHPMDWYGTGWANPRWFVQPFTGVSFAPDGRSLVFCTTHQDGGEERDAEGFLTRRGFALYTLPIPDLPEDAGAPEEQINLYLPAERAAGDRTSAAVMLPGTATTWPAETVWHE